MCQECGCNEEKDIKKVKESFSKIIPIKKSLTQENDEIAHIMWHDLQEKGVFCVNIMGAPGSGKTTFIEGLSKHIPPKDVAVIQGDLESDIDKKRLEQKGIETYQINTHSACHLNAQLTHDAFMKLNLKGKKYLFIENVGNLVCPTGVKIGQHLNLVVSATTEGSDKPKKYPIIFHYSKLAIISKYDLASLVEFDEETYVRDVKEANPLITILRTSSKDEISFKEIADYFAHEREHLLEHVHKH